jgi:hypothetical protein
MTAGGQHATVFDRNSDVAEKKNSRMPNRYPLKKLAVGKLIEEKE